MSSTGITRALSTDELAILDDLTVALDIEGLGKWRWEAFCHVTSRMAGGPHGPMQLSNAEAVEQARIWAFNMQSETGRLARERAAQTAEILALFD